MNDDVKVTSKKITYSETADRFFYDANSVTRPATDREVAGEIDRLTRALSAAEAQKERCAGMTAAEWRALWVRAMGQYESAADDVRSITSLFQAAWRDTENRAAERDRALTALRAIQRIGPLGVDTYPECYRRIQALVGDALRGATGSGHETNRNQAGPAPIQASGVSAPTAGGSLPNISAVIRICEAVSRKCVMVHDRDEFHDDCNPQNCSAMRAAYSSSKAKAEPEGCWACGLAGAGRCPICQAVSCGKCQVCDCPEERPAYP